MVQAAIKIPSRDADLWSSAEREAWRRPQDYTVSQWADTHRMMDPKTSAEPGQWRTSRTPYLREVMDAGGDRHVETITLMTSTQVGKTETLLNMLGYCIDQDPGPAMLVMPDEPSAKSVSKTRVKPMIENSPALARHLPRDEDNMTSLEYNLDNMIVYFAGALSPGKLASKPVKYVFTDELDKYPRFSGREATPMKLARERTRTFWNRKIVQSSTPTTEDGYIYKEYEKSDQRKYYVPCPHCGHYQILIFHNVKFPPDERDSARIKEYNLAWYECEKCLGKIVDKDKDAMLQRGVWVPKGGHIENGVVVGGKVTDHRGYWLNCIYSPWLTFGEIVAEFLDSKDDRAKLMNFTNSWLAEVWTEKAEEKDPDKLKNERCTVYESGTVPANVHILTAAIDVQQDYFKFTVRGWGVDEESWLIRANRLEKWSDVEKALYTTVYGERGLKIRLTCIDSRYRTNEVYEFCRKHRGACVPIKGADFVKTIYSVHPIDKDYNGHKIKGGLQYYMVDTNYFKDKLQRFISSAPGDIGQWHLPSDISDDYLKEMCGECKKPSNDKKGRTRMIWQKVTQHSRVDYWDTEVYNLFAADLLGVSKWRSDVKKIEKYQGEKRRTRNTADGSWVGDRSGWLRGK